jgi:ribulose-5-phosphate 4-epimerase/fuculose-1-phosphate aldolase
MSETGYVKFHCELVAADAVPMPVFLELNAFRNLLFKRKLIGIYPNGIGYGNISVRSGRANQFYVSGSATGGIELLSIAHYAKVTDYDFEKNWLRCEGRIQASSESMTHAAIYESDAAIDAVIHVHDMGLWQKLLYKVPTTSKEIEYGTPGMAYEVRRLFRETDVSRLGIIAMAGHEEGIFTFGSNLGEAFERLMSYYEEMS